MFGANSKSHDSGRKKKVRTAVWGYIVIYIYIPTRMQQFSQTSSHPLHPSAAARFSERTLRLKLRLRVFRSWCWLVDEPRYVGFNCSAMKIHQLNLGILASTARNRIWVCLKIGMTFETVGFGVPILRPTLGLTHISHCWESISCNPWYKDVEGWLKVSKKVIAWGESTVIPSPVSSLQAPPVPPGSAKPVPFSYNWFNWLITALDW